MKIHDYKQLISSFATAHPVVDYFNQPTLQRNFAVCCANLARFMPELSPLAMPAIFNELIRRLALAHEEQHYMEEALATLEGWDDGWLRLLRERPGIVCTFHTGSYRLLGRLIASHGLPVALVLASNVLEKQGPDFIAAYQAICSKAGKGQLQLIDAEKPTSALAMMRALRQGFQLVVYVDGNVGAGHATNQKNLLKLDFMHSQLLVRQGIGQLAVRTGAPVYPVICTRPAWGRLRLDLMPAITPDARKPEHAQAVMGKLYKLLADTLYGLPQEWEGWLYLHPTANDKPIPWLDRLCPGRAANVLWPLRMGHRCFALHATLGKAYPVSQRTYMRLVNHQRERLGFA